MNRMILFCIIFSIVGCKTAKQNKCEELQIIPTLNIYTFDELINFKKEDREVSLVVLD